jgi:DNA-binding NtrC family response regulator
MKYKHTILIADRNPHVRTFLKREMSAEGYQIQLANTGHEVLKRAFGHDPLHLIIIDPDLPDADDLDVLKRLEDRVPALPIIIHGFVSEYNESPAVSGAAVFVEKGGKSIERLKVVAAEMLQKTDPRYPGSLEDKRPPQGEGLHGTG